MNDFRLVADRRLATLLGVRVDWLRSEASSGRLPAVHAGDRYLFDPETVERLLLNRARAYADDDPEIAPENPLPHFEEGQQ